MLIRVILAACLSLYGLGGCASRIFTQPRSDTLIIARVAEPPSLNPLLLQGRDAVMVATLGYSFLTTYDARGRIVADVATQVPTVANGGISRDGLRIVYHLRRNIRWQDGYPLTARDVVFTFRAIMNPANLVPSRDPYDRIAKVRALDPYTVVAELKQPYAPIVPNFFGGESNYGILPAHLLAAYPNLNQVAFNGAPIGSGPYRFTRWVHGDRLELTANERYYGTKPTIRHIIIRFVPDSSTIVTQLKTHEADATFRADPSTIATLRSIPNHRVLTTLGPYFTAVVFNLSDPIVKDVVIRRALALAIDRRTLAAKATLGLYDPYTGMRGMFTWAFDPHAGGIPYDVARARVLLSQDGWRLGDGKIRFRNGQPLELQLLFSQQSFGGSEVVPIIVEDARAVGIDVVARPYAFSTMFAPTGPIYQGKFQIALVNYQHSLDPDSSAFLSCQQRAPRGFNWPRYCSETVDNALQRGVAVFDRNERRRIYSFIQRQVIADIPYYFLWQTSDIDVIPSALQGYANDAGSPYSSAAHWRLGAAMRR